MVGIGAYWCISVLAGDPRTSLFLLAIVQPLDFGLWLWTMDRGQWTSIYSITTGNDI